MRSGMLLLIVAAGCQRGVCDVDHNVPQKGKMDAVWSAHQDLIPSGTKLCGYADYMKSLDVDFDPQPDNPVVEVIKFYEAKGWTRTMQDTKGDVWQINFDKGAEQIHVMGVNRHKRTSLDLEFRQKKAED